MSGMFDDWIECQMCGDHINPKWLDVHLERHKHVLRLFAELVKAIKEEATP